MLIFISFAAAVIPMILYLFLIWRFDRYDREPIGLVLINYFWGAVAAIVLTLIIGSTVNHLISFIVDEGDYLEKLQLSISAPVIEETMKGFFLLLMIQHKKFDNITDGIVYGGAIGLGFGMTENFMYFVASSDSTQTWILVVIVRTLFSAVMHCVATGTLGAFLAYSKYKSRISKFGLSILGLLAAIIIHSTWNTFISMGNLAWIGFLFMLFTISLFIILFNFSVLSEKKIIYSELLEESQNGLIPEDHLTILNSKLRNKTGWISETIRKEYVTVTISLAFQKLKQKNSHGLVKKYIETEIDRLRLSISKLLDQNNLTNA
jgi:RsiW-degrading membrane proteinase PrsW (M82 family)